MHISSNKSSSLKSAMVGVFMPWELRTATRARLYFLHKHLPAHHCICSYFKKSVLPRTYLGESISWDWENQGRLLGSHSIWADDPGSKIPMQQLGHWIQGVSAANKGSGSTNNQHQREAMCRGRESFSETRVFKEKSSLGDAVGIFPQPVSSLMFQEGNRIPWKEEARPSDTKQK